MKHNILQIKEYNDSVFVLRLERNGLTFEPGQYVTLNKPDRLEKREYTLYSSPDKDFLELLIKDITGGDVSGELHRCQIGECLELDGPFGSFTIPRERREGKFLFIATGTGIAPFHSFVTSYPSLDYQLLHGVRSPEQLYGLESFSAERHIACLSRSNHGRYRGRVTDYLKQHPVAAESFYYLCGSSDMIHDVFEILQTHGVPRHHLFTEIYF